MTVVVDLGCCGTDDFDSMEILKEECRPRVIYGFDPGMPVGDWYLDERGIETIYVAAAAWTYNGAIRFQDDTVASCVVIGDEPVLRQEWRLKPATPRVVKCFDLAQWLNLRGKQVTLKMDVEGSEYHLLPHLIATRAIERVELLLIEWHGEPIEVPCRVEDWSH